jgi:signal transduction histidine kinase
LKRPDISKISIKWQLFAYIALFAAIMLLLLWLFQVVFLRDFYKAVKINELKSVATQTAANINSSSLDSYLASAAHSNEAVITVTDLSGNTESTSFSPEQPFLGSTLSSGDYAALIALAQKKGGTYSEWLNDNGSRDTGVQPDSVSGLVSPPSQGGNKIVFVKTGVKSDGTGFAIIVEANIEPVDATVTTIRTQLIILTFIMLVLALLIALLMSRRISKPIVKFSDSAKELARGNYDISFDGKGYREITELGAALNYAACELGKTENLRRELIANVSHDLRTPLTMITGYGEVMRDLPGENTPENVQVIIDESNRLTALVNDMLDLSKLEASTEEMKFERFNLTESIREILKRYSKLTGPGGYTIKFLQDCDVFVRGDELHISQVIYNLVNNAINYSGKDKLVIVRQSLKNDCARIEVIDTGEGIPKDKLPLIWDRYYKVDRDHRMAKVGTGLGLSIVKKILDRHGADYGVESTVGEGSVFWFEMKTDSPEWSEDDKRGK